MSTGDSVKEKTGKAYPANRFIKGGCDRWVRPLSLPSQRVLAREYLGSTEQCDRSLDQRLTSSVKESKYQAKVAPAGRVERPLVVLETAVLPLNDADE